MLQLEVILETRKKIKYLEDGMLKKFPNESACVCFLQKNTENEGLGVVVEKVK